MKGRLATLLVVVMVLMSSTVYADNSVIEQGLGKLWYLMDFAKTTYVYETTYEALFEAAYHGLFDAMDSDSVYYNAQEFDVLLKQLESTSTGPGVVVQRINGQVDIMTVYKDSSAETAGLRPGDVLLKVNEQDIGDLTINEINGLLNGTQGSTVLLEVHRQGLQEPLKASLFRTQMNPNQIRFEALENGIGYVQIVEFSMKNTLYFDQALQSLVKDSGVSKLIIDVRDCVGGEIEAVQHAVDQLTPAGKVLMQIDYRAYEDTIFTTSIEGYQLPMIILANERTVGGAELFTASLKERGYAAVVGAKTYGDGGLQWITPLEDGSGLKLTAGYVLSGDGVSFDNIGIAPHHIVENKNLEIERIYGLFAPMNTIKNSIVGMSDKATLGAQQRLKYLGYSIEASGYFTRETEYAIAQFQLANGILNSGILNWETKAALDEKVREKAIQVIDDQQLAKAIELLKGQ